MANDLWLKLSSSLSYLKKSDLAQVRRAFDFAVQKHQNQTRKSREPYITHPIAVAIILAGYKFDKEVISAALLHDLLEDTPTKLEEISKNFGRNIARIVKDLTNIAKIPLKDKSLIFTDEEQYLERAEDYRKLLVAMAKNIKVMAVKLADRLHNIQTVEHLGPEKRKFYARETIEIYAKIADRLGMSGLKHDLEDLSFPHAYPKEFQKFKQMVKTLKIKQNLIEQKISEIKNLLASYKILPINIYGRIKHDFSLYQKLARGDNPNLASIYDLYGLRIIAKKVGDCYQILGLVHTIYTPLPGRIFDYIAEPRDFGYQSLHTTVKDKEGNIFEIQIRTEEMHRITEVGMASHWKYKDISLGKATPKLKQSYDEWVREVEKLHRIKNKQKILDYLKEELFSDKIFVLTPKREIIKLPRGSGAIDFAFRVHTSVGLHIAGVKINDRIAPIESELKNGDVVEILTRPSAEPSIDWLKIAKTSHAQRKIRQFLRTKNRPLYVQIGEQSLDQFILKHNLPRLTENFADKLINESRLPYQTREDALVAVAEKDLPIQSLIKILYPNFFAKEKKVATKKAGIARPNKLSGIKNVYAKCCNPKKGDELTGYVGQDHLIKIHKRNCGMIKNVNPDRLIDL